MAIWIMIAVMCLLGAAAMGLALLTMWLRVRSSRSWPTTDARIVTAEVRRGYRHGFIPHVHYTYTVGPRAYSSTRIHPGRLNVPEDTAQEIVRRFPVGSVVPIRYQPDRPGYSVLESKLSRGFAMLALIAVVWLAFGLTGLALALAERP